VIRECLSQRQRARARARDAAFVEADLAFHRSVVAAAHNALLAEMFGSFQAVLREALAAIVSDRGLDDVGADAGHVRLAAAIEAGDPEAAERATLDHLDPTAAALHALIGH
jgi:GntR family transcriptional regulator, transcriptional repressor for pyruvate dehydrogenase complex